MPKSLASRQSHLRGRDTRGCMVKDEEDFSKCRVASRACLARGGGQGHGQGRRVGGYGAGKDTNGKAIWTLTIVSLETLLRCGAITIETMAQRVG